MYIQKYIFVYCLSLQLDYKLQGYALLYQVPAACSTVSDT